MGSPNTQHSDKWKVIFSNIPGYTPDITDNTTMGLYDLFVKDLTFPSLSLKLVQSHFRNYEINHQISKINDELGDLTITFKASEGILNYWYIFSWIKSMREQENIDDEKWFRLNVIKETKVLFLDNQKRPKYRYIFSNGFIVNLSSLILTNGLDNEITFDITIHYEDVNVETIENC